MPCLLLLIFVGGITTTLYFFATWILGPVDQAGKRLSLPMQFTLVDFFCLFFLIQLPMALIHFQMPDGEDSHTPKLLMDAFVWISLGSLWWVSVRTLSRAGITNLWHRAVFLTVVLPLSVVGAMAVPVLTVAIVGMLAEGNASGNPVGWLVTADVGLLAAGVASGFFTRHIVKQPPP